MSNLKDTDIDDLFRRASDKYPLRTDSSDWDRMAAALEKDPPPNPPYDLDETDNRRKRRFFWLFLLLPLAGAGYLFLHRPGNGHPAGDAATTQSATAQTSTTPTAQAQTSPTPTSQSETHEPQTNQPPTHETTSAATPPPTNPATTAGPAGAGMPPQGAGSALAAGQSSMVRPGALNSLNAAGTNKAHRMANFNYPNSQGTRIRSGLAHGDIPVRPETNTKTRNKNGTNHFADDNTTKPEPDAVTNNTSTTSASNAFSLRATNINGPLAPTASPYFVSVDVKAPVIAKDKDTTKKPATSQKKKSSYLYAGIMGAPDLSTVHFQKMTGTGTTFTLLLGYAFNSHWSIESGISLDRKRYYSDGEYFTVPKGMLGNNDYLKNVDGTCYMWEIPLNVRYNFNPEGKTKWFATAGLSTYLMTKEKYNFQYGWNGWGGTWDSSYSTKQPSQYPFSVINLSFGFEQRLGKIGNLRIEPYARIPLSGVGTGKLPILSTGINIGFTRRLWK